MGRCEGVVMDELLVFMVGSSIGSLLALAWLLWWEDRM